MVVLHAVRAKANRTSGLEPIQALVIEPDNAVLQMDFTSPKEPVRDDVCAVRKSRERLRWDAGCKKSCVALMSVFRDG